VLGFPSLGVWGGWAGLWIHAILQETRIGEAPEPVPIIVTQNPAYGGN